MDPNPARASLLAAVLCCLPATVARGQTAPDPTDPAAVEARLAALEESAKAAEGRWRLEWKDTFRLRSPDGSLSFTFGGRVHQDWAVFDVDPELEAEVGAFEDGTELRRGRIYFAGTLYDRVELKAEYDFAGGEATARDVYMGLIKLPGVGGIRVGHFKEPFSLEELHSTNYPIFMEKGLPVEAFAPSRNSGLMAHRGRERFSFAAGAFLETDDFAESADGDAWAFTGRVTALPWRPEGGDGFLHLGLAASQREPGAGSARFRSRPDSHLAPRLIDTGALAADSTRLAGLELVWVRGPLTVQAEHLRAAVDRPRAAQVDLSGSYVTASWFLTGESRPYRTSTATYDRLRPVRPLGSGPGAWEVAVRWSNLDLSEIESAGEAEDWTVGVNWYLYSNVRAMLNIVRAELEGVGEVDVVQTRFQVDF